MVGLLLVLGVVWYKEYIIKVAQEQWEMTARYRAMEEQVVNMQEFIISKDIVIKSQNQRIENLTIATNNLAEIVRDVRKKYYNACMDYVLPDELFTSPTNTNKGG